MQLRRTASIFVAAVTAASLGLLVEGPAQAVPSQRGSSAQAKSYAGKVSCAVDVAGVSTSRKYVVREVENGEVLRQKIARRPLAFTPASAGFLSQRDVADGYIMDAVSTVRGRGPRVLKIRWREWSPALTVSSRPIRAAHFTARLLASTGSHVFTIDSAGRLHRWKVRQAPNGKVSFVGRRLVRKGLGNVRTMSFYRRMAIGGAAVDVIMMTTSSGALKQIRVPVRQFRQDRTTIIKGGGFRRFSGLSLGSCDGDPNQMMIVAIDAGRNRADWMTLAQATQPQGANLSIHGRVGRGMNWRLGATF